jgi:hypothetical protein
MTSNLPDGVTENMIPGNRPEDMAEDAFWDAYFEKLPAQVDNSLEKAFGEFWAESDGFRDVVLLAREMGYEQGFSDGKDEAAMSQMAEECIRCGYAHSVQEHCHCDKCDHSHGPDFLDCLANRMVD